jgi:hypothetical protein
MFSWQPPNGWDVDKFHLTTSPFRFQITPCYNKKLFVIVQIINIFFLSNWSQFLEVENGNYVPYFKFSIFLGCKCSDCRLKSSATVWSCICVPVCQSYMVIPSAWFSMKMVPVRPTSRSASVFANKITQCQNPQDNVKVLNLSTQRTWAASFILCSSHFLAQNPLHQLAKGLGMPQTRLGRRYYYYYYYYYYKRHCW